nr:MAG TPA: hypothetical protein [Caudoviricetes sp.]
MWQIKTALLYIGKFQLAIKTCPIPAPAWERRRCLCLRSNRDHRKRLINRRKDQCSN